MEKLKVEKKKREPENKNRVKRALIFMVLPALLGIQAGCTKLRVTPEILAPDAQIKDPGKEAPGVRLKYKGDDWERDDWALAYPASNNPLSRSIFYRRMENTTGSIRKLLGPAVEEVIRRRGYRLVRAGAKESTEYELELELKRAEQTWKPAAEFIQSPTASRPGKAEIRFEYGMKMTRAGTEILNENYKDTRIEHAFPGDEGDVLALMAYQDFRYFVEHLLKKIPLAGK